MKTEMTRAEYLAAHDDFDALREAFEMRLDQAFYIEAFFHVIGDTQSIIIANYSFGEMAGCFDFSQHAEMMEFNKTADAKFYKTDNLADLYDYVNEIVQASLTEMDA